MRFRSLMRYLCKNVIPMLKRYLFLWLFSLSFILAKAQVTDTVLLNKMGDFDLAALNGDSYSALQIGEQILPDTGKMTSGIRTNFFAKLAKAYDEIDQDNTAIIYYQKVDAGAPDYFVAQRALGLLYNENAEDIQLKLYITPKDNPNYKSLFSQYEQAVRKALPHLEKAQACDPDDDTLDLIRTLYRNINDEAGYTAFLKRIPDLAKKCVDLLEDK
jgi:tetratricopeptide (TPR) repeat protein